MAEERIDLPEGFDPEAVPTEYPGLMRKIKRIRFIQSTVDRLDKERKSLQREVIPRLRGPVALLDPRTGEPIVATATQSHTKVVDAQALLVAMLEHYKAEGMELEDAAVKADELVQSVLKPREVDTKEGGLFEQAHSRGDIPLSVVAKCAYLKPNSAYIQFPRKRK